MAHHAVQYGAPHIVIWRKKRYNELSSTYEHTHTHSWTHKLHHVNNTIKRKQIGLIILLQAYSYIHHTHTQNDKGQQFLPHSLHSRLDAQYYRSAYWKWFSLKESYSSTSVKLQLPTSSVPLGTIPKRVPIELFVLTIPATPFPSSQITFLPPSLLPDGKVCRMSKSEKGQHCNGQLNPFSQTDLWQVWWRMHTLF